MRQIDTNFACFIVQGTLKRSSNDLWIYVTVILVKIVANLWQWKRIITASLETKAMVALFINLDHSLLDICPLRLCLQPLCHIFNVKSLNSTIILHANQLVIVFHVFEMGDESLQIHSINIILINLITIGSRNRYLLLNLRILHLRFLELEHFLVLSLTLL